MADVKCSSCKVVVVETSPRYRPDRLLNPMMLRIKPIYHEYLYVEWPRDESCVMEALCCPSCEGPFADGRGKGEIIKSTITPQDIHGWSLNLAQRDGVPVDPDGIEREFMLLLEHDLIDPMAAHSLMHQVKAIEVVDAEKRKARAEGRIPPNEKVYRCWCGQRIVSQAAWAGHTSGHNRRGEKPPAKPLTESVAGQSQQPQQSQREDG